MKKRSPTLLIAGAILIFLLTCTAGLYLSISLWPSLGAQGADVLRSIVGDKPVALLEMIYLRAGDEIQQLEYKLGITEAEAPWEFTLENTEEPLQPTAVQFPTATEAKELVEAAGEDQPAAMLTSTPALDQGLEIPTPSLIPPTPTVEPTPTPWAPRQVQSVGEIEGEGIWSPYIRNAAGEVIAYRSFVQPDPERPYSVVAIVAFDTSKIELNFVLGFEEPYNPEAPKRSGKILEEHKVPGTLLAAFNGGFKGQHGQSGAMSGGLVVLPPRDGLGTVAMYEDGRITMGEWGSEIIETDDMTAWRQNGPLVVQDGGINPRINNNDPKDWGYTVDDVSPTLRSGLGISEDENTLYYFAGPKLTMEALANAMLAGGARDGIQLDINNYWVHFVVYPANLDELSPEVLLPDLMIENFDRYLDAFGRDYFYITPREE